MDQINVEFNEIIEYLVEETNHKLYWVALLELLIPTKADGVSPLKCANCFFSESLSLVLA